MDAKSSFFLARGVVECDQYRARHEVLLLRAEHTRGHLCPGTTTRVRSGHSGRTSQVRGRSPTEEVFHVCSWWQVRKRMLFFSFAPDSPSGGLVFNTFGTLVEAVHR